MDNYANVAYYIDWIKEKILDSGGMSSCGFTIAAVPTAEPLKTTGKIRPVLLPGQFNFEMQLRQ